MEWRLTKTLGFYGSAGAVIVAMNKAIEMKIYDPHLYNITFVWYFSQCDESLSGGYASQMIMRDQVSAILGPVCPEEARMVGSLAAYKNRPVPVFPWGVALPPEFYDIKNYGTVMPMSGTVRGMIIALSNVLSNYNWTQIAFVYNMDETIGENIPECGAVSGMFESGTDYLVGIETYVRQVRTPSVESFQAVLQDVKPRARIIVTCLESTAIKQNFTRAIANENLNGPEYVYIFLQSNGAYYGNPPFWVVNGKTDDILKQTTRNILIMDKFINDTEESQDARQQIADGIRGWPFYCTNCSTNANASNLSMYLGDAMLTLLVAYNKSYTRTKTGQFSNATDLQLEFRSNVYQIPSIFGSTFTFSRGIRLARYSLNGLDGFDSPSTYAVIHGQTKTTFSVFNVTYDDAATSIWKNRGGKQPLSEPLCGFSNQKCLSSPLLYTFISVGCILFFVLVVLILSLAIFISHRQQQSRLNAMWQVSHFLLDKIEDRSNSNSTRSMQSLASNLNRRKTEKTEFLYYDNEIVVAIKRPHSGHWTAEDEREFRMMRTSYHPNLNRFIGVAMVEQHQVFYLFNYCERGSLVEVLEAQSFRMDFYIMSSMIKDIIEAVNFIHNSPFGQHGNLSAFKCLVGERFEVKVQMHGMSSYKARTTRLLNDQSALYVAPEHLQGQQNLIGSAAGDIYALAIISAVVLTMKNAYDWEMESESQEEIVTKVRSGNYPVTRPSLEHIDPSIEVNPEMVSLIKSCWSERPDDRPKIAEIRQFFLKRIMNSRASVMDHIMALMENQAVELEQDVHERQVQLMEEKRKADILLNRMMPKEAADKLKLGQTVEPEVYSSCTIFFCDIVGFTVISSKSTPLQIINFLNDVYTLADGVIDQHDVYKVETIGDGMHVVSGVPKRNGHKHVSAIADMSLDFVRAIKKLRLEHMPSHTVQMRVGIHSGTSVAGIVGATAPRFCVFGDTVNIAAKMESSGQPGRIHISPSSKQLIDAHYPGQYNLVARGESLIKGIGTMSTFWLVPPEDLNDFQS
ncbi:Guanylate cyclase [Aphelenchoides besseyi]|nr:Guanylate cyclase [Aphelenchoides besseyi]